MTFIAIASLLGLGGLGYAYIKHVGLATLKAGLAAEVAKLEASAAKVEASVKSEISASVAKIKSLL